MDARASYAATPPPHQNSSVHRKVPHGTSAPPAPRAPVSTSTNSSISGSLCGQWTVSASITAATNAAPRPDAQHARRLSLKSSSTASASGYVRLSRQGYNLALSPDRTAVTGYFTAHRERTWEQVKNKCRPASTAPPRTHRSMPRGWTTGARGAVRRDIRRQDSAPDQPGSKILRQTGRHGRVLRSRTAHRDSCRCRPAAYRNKASNVRTDCSRSNAPREYG